MIEYEKRAKELVAQCKTANSEATVALRIETMLTALLSQRGVNYEPQHEVRVLNQRKRMDSQFGAVVTEHKKHIQSTAEWEAHTQQLVDYIEEIAPKPEFRDEHLGIVTDGERVRFATFEGGIAHPEIPIPLDGHVLKRWADSLVALERRGLTAKNLVEDFALIDAGTNSVGTPLARALYDALGAPSHKTVMLRDEYQRLFAQAVDHRESPSRHLDAYRNALGIVEHDEVDGARALFALQTAYAIVVKLVAMRVLTDLRFGTSVISFDQLAALTDAELRDEQERIEDGHLLRELQIDNLLEGDFFSWYVDSKQWSPKLANAVREVIRTLKDYEGRGPVLKPRAIRDLFRQVYQRFIPPEIRHDLGEYYTPRWLAQATIQGTPKPNGWSGLDPCCGSGTFLLELISEVLEEATSLAPRERLEQVLTRVNGLDLNPLAVLTARVNYLLAISELLEQVDMRIELPVYLGDAAYLPHLSDLGGVPALEYSLTTSKGNVSFSLPLSLAQDAQAFGSVMLQVEQAVLAQDKAAGIAALCAALPSTDLNHAVEGAIESLVDNLLELEKNAWDRIWARVIKNYLATATLGRFERVVGNPPWVEWKDLPDGYRETIKDLCRERGIFSDDTYSGGTDLNVSVLIAHTVLEKWVANKGHLGFLMPRSVLQLRSTQGFRRWRLPNGDALSLRALSDWSKLQPFEGATTNPVGYTIQRGEPAIALVPFTEYSTARSGTPHRNSDKSWPQVVRTLDVRTLAAVPIGDDGAPYLIDEEEALPDIISLFGIGAYSGRRATETSPHSVRWLAFNSQPRAGLVRVENDVNPHAKNRVPKGHYVLETEFLYPTLQGKNIKEFEAEIPSHVVVLPHTPDTGPKAVLETELRHRAPLTYAYLRRHRSTLESGGSQRKYRQGQPFYAAWRVGHYTFAPYKVVWPEMGVLRAAVVSCAETPWGERRMVVPEGKVNLIACETEQEAHYVCAFLNAPIVRRAYSGMSSQIGRPVRLPFAIPKYKSNRITHRALTCYSDRAHSDAYQRDGRVLDRLVARLMRGTS